MTKQTQNTEENIERYNPKTQYRSVEGKIQDSIVKTSKETVKNIADITRHSRQRISNGIKHTKEFLGEFIPYFTQMGTSIWRIPTIARKNSNNQLRVQLQNHENLSRAEKIGCFSGYALGAGVTLAQGLYAIGTAAEGDFAPAIAILSSNAIDGAYEVGRIKETKTEKKGLKNYLELKAQEPTIEPRADQ
jgi:hypothetical protein